MFISKKINQKALLEFVTKFKELGYLQQMAILHNDELQLKFAVAPYEITDVKQLFSVSKTFTSMAYGLAISEGRLGLHDKVIDYFKEFLPEKISPNLAKMEIYHLLTMTTGHPSCTMAQIACPNPIKAFFELPVPYEPGTFFAYNTGASLILSIIITMVTGKSLDDYIKPVLDGLDIKDYYFEKMNGACLGGVGTHVNIEGLLNFGSMLLNKGRFNGKQLVPADYVEMATSKQVSTEGNGTIDWTQGYGLHLWMSQVGYRCDGAYGQLVLVLPEDKMVIAVQARVDSMQNEMNLIMELVKNLYSNDVLDNIEQKINDVYKIESTNKVPNIVVELDQNNLRINKAIIKGSDDKLEVEFIGDNAFKIEAGNGYYIKNKFYATGIKAKISGLMPEFNEEINASCHYMYNGNNLEIILKNHNTPLNQSIVFEFENNKCLLKINNRQIVGKVDILD